MLQSSSSDEDDYDDHDQPDHYDISLPGYNQSNQGNYPNQVGSGNNSNPNYTHQHSSTSSHGHAGLNNRDSVGSAGFGSYQQQHTSARSTHSGSSDSPATSRAASLENTRHAGSSFDTVSISSGLSVPPAGYDNGRTIDGGSIHNTPRHERYHNNNHSRSNSFRGSDRSPQPIRRSNSPTASVISDREREDLEKLNKEEDEHRQRLQIYVFVLRCVAFPFNAKQPHDMQRRQTKISKQELAKIKERFAAFLNGETPIMADEAFKNAVQSYYEVFLKSDRVTSMVRSGACSANDFREVFKNNIEKRVRSLPEIDGLSKETVLSSWMTKFDTIYRGDENDLKQRQRNSTSANELILSKDQLYEMFQNVLNIKKYEHLILYNALQVSITYSAFTTLPVRLPLVYITS